MSEAVNPWPSRRQIITRDGWNPWIRYVLVQDEATLSAMLDTLSRASSFAWDTETSGLKPEMGARACGHSFACRTGEHELTGWYVPIRHVGPANEHDTQLRVDEVSARLSQLFSRTSGPEVRTYHAKFDRKIARADGVELHLPYVDVGIAATVHNENEPRFGLKDLAEKYCTEAAKGEEGALDAWMHKDARQLGISYKRHSKQQIAKLGGVIRAMLTPTYLQRYGYARTPIRLCGTYAIHDVIYTWWLAEVQYARTRREFAAVWQREHAVADALLEMEWHGLPASKAAIQAAHERTGDAVHHWLDVCRQLAPGLIDETFEASGEELRELLFTKLKLQPQKHTKKDAKPSADWEARQLLKHAYPEHRALLNAVDALADVLKLHSTYAGSFLRFYSEARGTINPSYNQLEQRDEGGVPVTGRLSSADPNAQNMAGYPLHLWDCHCASCLKDEAKAAAEEGRAVQKDDVSLAARQLRALPIENTVSVRRYFVVPEGHIRIFVDFSQIELRVLAWFCQDPNLVRAYVEGLDVHQMVADQLGITRRVAKEVNFGNSYGMTEVGLALRLPGYFADPEGKRREAAEVLRRYFDRYRGILQFRKDFALEMRRNNCSFVNPFGRPRRIKEIASHDQYERERAERKMMSSIISGTAADLMKESMIRTRPMAESIGGRMVQTIHDELVYDLPLSAPWASMTVKMVRAMEDWPMFSQDRGRKLGVPIRTNVAMTTRDWSQKREIKLYDDGTFAIA